MDEILQDLSSLRWWFGVVVAGLFVSLLSAYLKQPIDRAISRISGFWRKRVAKKQAEQDKLLATLKTDDKIFTLYAIQSSESRLRGIQNLILSGIVFLFGYIASVHEPGFEVNGYIGGAFFSIGSR